MKPFLYCPSCATRLAEANSEGGATCPSCGREWFRDASPTAGAAIVQDGRALVTQRAREPEKGKFDVPGGFLRPGEEPIEGLKREVREELGIEIDTGLEQCISMEPHTYGPEGDFVLALGFRARLVSGDPSPADDVAAFKWVTTTDLDGLDFAWPHDRELIRRALDDESW
jgi:ADP-ribose pyrophosphatase YjhB (NUDIX family)